MHKYAIACEDNFLNIGPYSGVQRVAKASDASQYGELQLPRLRSLIRILPDGSHIVEVSNAKL